MFFDFPVNITSAEDFELVPAIFKQLYAKQADGSYVLHEDAQPHLDLAGLKTSLTKERTQRKTAEKEVAEWRSLSETPDGLKTQMEELKAQATKAAGVDARTLEKAVAEVRDGAAKAEAQYKQNLATMEASLSKHMIHGEAARQIAAANGNVDLLMPHVTSQTRMFVESGEYVVRVVDKDGDVRHTTRGNPMGIADLIGEMRSSQSFGPAFKVEPKAGSGKAPGSVGTTPSGAPSDPSTRSPVSRIQAGLESRQA